MDKIFPEVNSQYEVLHLKDGHRGPCLTGCEISNRSQQCTTRIVTGEEATFKMKFEVTSKGFIARRHFAVRVLDIHTGELLSSIKAPDDFTKVGACWRKSSQIPLRFD